MKKAVKELNQTWLLGKCKEKALIIAAVGEDGGWLRLWDEVLNLGERHTKGLRNLSRMMSHHGHGSKPCPMCDWMPGEGTVFDHVILRHGEELGLLGMTQDGVMQNLKLSDLYMYSINCTVYSECSLLGGMIKL